MHGNWLQDPRYAEDRAPWSRHYFGGGGRVEPLNTALCALYMSTTVSHVVQNSSDSLPAPFLWTIIITIMLSTGGKGKNVTKNNNMEIKMTFPGNVFSGKRLSGKVTFREQP